MTLLQRMLNPPHFISKNIYQSKVPGYEGPCKENIQHYFVRVKKFGPFWVRVDNRQFKGVRLPMSKIVKEYDTKTFEIWTRDISRKAL